MATAISDVFGTDSSTQILDLIAGIGLTPTAPQAVAFGAGSWPSSVQRDVRPSRIPRGPSTTPCGPRSARRAHP
jgi:hypothetical protein